MTTMRCGTGVSSLDIWGLREIQFLKASGPGVDFAQSKGIGRLGTESIKQLANIFYIFNYYFNYY